MLEQLSMRIYASSSVLPLSYLSLVSPTIQRITEQAGVVLTLDPKPIEVINDSHSVLLNLYESLRYLFDICINRVIGMVPDATQITGT